jgi:hypothetical protein
VYYSQAIAREVKLTQLEINKIITEMVYSDYRIVRITEFQTKNSIFSNTVYSKDISVHVEAM